MNSAETVIQTGAIEMGLSDYWLICCTRNTSLLKLNEQRKLSIRSVENYSDEIFVEQLRAIKFPDYFRTNEVFICNQFCCTT